MHDEQTSEVRPGIHRNGPGERVDLVARQVIGAAIEVHRALGPGYLESVYEQSLCVELTNQGLRCVRQHPFAVEYKGHAVGEGRLDVLVDDAVVIELKAVDHLAPVHQAQLLSYLKATGHRHGLLINFNVTVLKDGIKRLVH